MTAASAARRMNRRSRKYEESQYTPQLMQPMNKTRSRFVAVGSDMCISHANFPIASHSMLKKTLPWGSPVIAL